MDFPTKSPYVPCDDGTYTSCKLPKSVPDWLKDFRMQAFERFKEQGLPTQKLERFKYTNIAKAVAGYDGVLAEHGGSMDGEMTYVSALSDNLNEDWVKTLITREPPGQLKYGDSALWDLNTAYLKDGTVIDIPANTNVEKPFILNLESKDDSYISLRMIVRLGDGAEATIIENHTGEGEYWKNNALQVIVGKNAKLNHVIIHNDSKGAVNTVYTYASVERDATYDCFTLNNGNAVLRHQIQADMNGANGHVSFNGLNLLDGKQHSDTTILVNHKAPHCESNQFYRSLLADHSHGIFQGKVHVYEEAQKTDGYQLSNAILLSEHAVMDTKPELEIYADDVKCSHGATTGQMDEEPLFYLRSRGLSEKEARFLLVQAFVGEVLEKMNDDDNRASIEKDVMTWLQTAL